MEDAMDSPGVRDGEFDYLHRRYRRFKLDLALICGP
jgi:hypothetical protein